jgi:D-aspartate ligase
MSNRARLDVLLLGGQENALSLTRSLGSRGVTVRVSAPEPCYAAYSRFCAAFDSVPAATDPGAYWHALLLDSAGSAYEGSLVIPLSDDAVMFVATAADELARRYVLPQQRPDVQLAMLDKRRTLELAEAAGCAVPRHWSVSRMEDVERLLPTLPYPVAVKPIHSHLFQRAYQRKLLVAQTGEELAAAARKPLDDGIEVMLIEYVPGPHSLLNSYYTYLDEAGRPLFHYTKRIVRRSPNFGGATCHASRRLPETAEAGLRFFQGVGLLGFGNVEFKRDPRDGLLKVIECNPRFTAAQELLVRCGVDASLLVYAIASGETPPKLEARPGERWLWAPWVDLDSIRLQRTTGEASWFDWLRVLPHRLVFPYLSPRDPRPAVRKTHDAFDRARTRLRR